MVRMPVTGQDSFGSLTRNDGLDSAGMTNLSGENEEGREPSGKTSSWGEDLRIDSPMEKPLQAFLSPEVKSPTGRQL